VRLAIAGAGPGLLDLAGERGLVDFPRAVRKLELTRFRRPAALLETLIAKHTERRQA